jgi:electron transfer flavoprotein beta subunit
MSARSKEIAVRSLADLGLDPGAVGGSAAATRVVRSEAPPARGATVVVREPAREAAARVVEFLAERRLI